MEAENPVENPVKTVFQELISKFPQHDPDVLKLKGALNTYTKNIMKTMQQHNLLNPPMLGPNDDNPLLSSDELLSFVFFACFKLLKPPMTYDEYTDARALFQAINLDKLYLLLDLIPQRNSSEARFIEKILVTLEFTDSSTYMQNLEILQCLINQQDLIKFIPNFQTVTPTTEEAFRFINSLLEDENAQKLLAEAYEKLDILEENFEKEPSPEIKKKKKIIQHVQDLLPVVAVQYGYCDILLGRTFFDAQMAFTTKLFVTQNDGLNDNQRIALLVVTILHELGHKKRIKHYASGTFKKKTPDEFLGESGTFINRILYGESLTKYLPNFPIDLAEIILDLNSWKFPQFVDQLYKPKAKQFTKQSSRKSKVLHHKTWDPEEMAQSARELQEFIDNMLAKVNSKNL